MFQIINTIKELRKVLGISQSDLAKRLHMAPSSISMIEAGTRPLTDRLIHSISTEFGVSEEWLRTGEGDMFPPPPDEDSELIGLLAEFGAEDIDPRKKRFVSVVLQQILSLPDEEIPAFRAFLKSAYDALSPQKDDPSN